MGSSPVTATTSPALFGLTAHLGEALRSLRIGDRERLLVAFSGGGDSTALLLALRCLDDGRSLVAAHLDHAEDPQSWRRAAQAEAIAGELAVPFICHRLVQPGAAPRGGREAEARWRRYRWLEEQASRHRCAAIVTAHHADDQVETILMRLLFGSGLRGLAAMRPRRGLVVRPLLGLARAALVAAVAESGLQPVIDLTNRDLGRVRNRLRHLLLPRLLLDEPELPARLLEIGRRCCAAQERIDRLLTTALDLHTEGGGDRQGSAALPPSAIDTAARSAPRRQGPTEPEVGISALLSLPGDLPTEAIRLLHRRAGQHYPPRRKAIRALLDQLVRGEAADRDAGEGWRWRTSAGHLLLERRPTRPSSFAYTFGAPGTVVVPELALRIEVTRAPWGSWVAERNHRLGALAIGADTAGPWCVRNRRPGDRLQPMGSSYERKVKDILIDQKVPREHRDSLPLIVVGGRIGWIPGVVLHHRLRVPAGATEVWRIEVSSS